MFQLSLSTALTPPKTPCAGVIPALSGDFSAVLAGAAEASAASVPVVGIAATPRQGDAEAGKSLPTAPAPESIASDPALAWLDEAGLHAATTDEPSAGPATARTSAKPQVSAPDLAAPAPVAVAAPVASPNVAIAAPVLARAPEPDSVPPTTGEQPTVSAEAIAPKTPKAAEHTAPVTAERREGVDPSTGRIRPDPAVAATVQAIATTPLSPVGDDLAQNAPQANQPDVAAGSVAPLPPRVASDAPRPKAAGDASPPDPVAVGQGVATTASIIVAEPRPAPARRSDQPTIDTEDRDHPPKRSEDVSQPATVVVALPVTPPAANGPIPASSGPVGSVRPKIADPLILPEPTRPAGPRSGDAANTPPPAGAEPRLPDAVPPSVEAAPGQPKQASTPIAPREHASAPAPAMPSGAPTKVTSTAASADSATIRSADPATTAPQPARAAPSPAAQPIADRSAPADGKPIAFSAPAAPLVRSATPSRSAESPVRSTPAAVAGPAVTPVSHPTPPVAQPLGSQPAIPGTAPLANPIAAAPSEASITPAAPRPEATSAAPQPPLTRSTAAVQVTAEPSRPAPPAPLPVAPSAPQPAQAAAIVLGVAFGGVTAGQRPLGDDRASPREQALAALTALAGTGSAAPIAAPSQTQHGALDMQRQDWPQAMIDRIEALRDAADATSTRITLVPDALGKVDLSIRHDGDSVHVHFSAEAAQTRAILADAQPRLAELAQQRGVRLGQATVDAGANRGGQRQHPQFAAPAPQRPASAFATATAEEAADDSLRLA